MASLSIFIHGVGSNQNAWKQFIETMRESESNESFIELKNLNEQSIIRGKSYYYTYSYESNKVILAAQFNNLCEAFSGKENSGKITLESHKETFRSILSHCDNKFENIYLIGHSMGGLIIMKLLFSLIDNDSNLLQKIKKCVLIASPLKGSNDPKKLDDLTWYQISSPILNELTPDSKTMRDFNAQIEKNKSILKERMKILYINAQDDSRIIPITREYFENIGFFEQYNGGHSEIIRDTKDLNFVSTKIINFLYNETDYISTLLNIDMINTEVQVNSFMENITLAEKQPIAACLSELIINSKDKGKASIITLTIQGNTIILTDNGQKFNPLVSLTNETKGGGSITLDFLIHKRKDLKLTYEYKGSQNYISIELPPACIYKKKTSHINIDNSLTNETLHLLTQSVHVAVDTKCNEICLNFDKTHIIILSSITPIVGIILDNIPDKYKSMKKNLFINKSDPLTQHAIEKGFYDNLAKLHNLNIIINS